MNEDRLAGFNRIHGELSKEVYERVGKVIERAMEIDAGLGIEINDAVYALEQEVYNKTVDYVISESHESE
jgi:hypothetical protein